MNRYRLLLICTASLLSTACATNKQLVKTLAAAELKCDKSEVTVSFKSRLHFGIAKYVASGCNRSRVYACDRWNYGFTGALTGEASSTSVCEHDPQ